MSLAFDILKEMYYKELNYKGVKVNIFGIPMFLIKNKDSFRSTLSRMKRDGYIINNDGVWKITEKGKKLVKERAESFESFDSPFGEQDKKNLLLIFDIPEVKKAKRDWLRYNLKKFHYKIIQASVWLGPSPLPKNFVDYLERIKIKKYIKTYKLSKRQNV